MHEGVWKKHLDTWLLLWSEPATEDEKDVLSGLVKPAPEDQEREWTMELLYHLVKKQCIEHEISAALLLPRGDFNRLKSGSDHFDSSLLEGWRAELMGAELVAWMKKGGKVSIDWVDQQCRLLM
jgi:ribonuclease D